MLEKEIKIVLAQRGLKTSDVYKPLGIDKVVFYQAIRTSNLNNKTLKKILDFLGLEISVSLQEKKNDDANFSHLIVKKLSKDIWSVCTEQKCDGSLIMTPFCLLTEEMIRNAPYFQLEIDNPYELKRSNTEEVLKMWRAYKRVCDEN